MQTWLGVGVGRTIVGAFLLTPWLIDINHSKHITSCDPNTVILLTMVIIIDTYFLLISKNIKLDYYLKKITCDELVKF